MGEPINAYTEMHLCTDTVDQFGRGVDTLDETNHALGFRVIGVEIVIVDV